MLKQTQIWQTSRFRAGLTNNTLSFKSLTLKNNIGNSDMSIFMIRTSFFKFYSIILKKNRLLVSNLSIGDICQKISNILSFSLLFEITVLKFSNADTTFNGFYFI